MSDDQNTNDIPENEDTNPKPSELPADAKKEKKGPPLLESDEVRKFYYGRHPWLVFAIPFFVFMLFLFSGKWIEGNRETRLNEVKEKAAIKAKEENKAKAQKGEEDIIKDEHSTDDTAKESHSEEDAHSSLLEELFPIDKHSQPVAYTILVVATLVFILIALPGYREIPFKVSGLAIWIGVIGVVVWIALCIAGEATGLHKWMAGGDDQNPITGAIMALGGRGAFNPFAEMSDNPTWMWTFLAIRLFGMILIVPLVEEFFIRGFLMRYVDSANWEQVPLGYMTALSVGAVTVYGAVSHPEMLAGAAWFSMITWLYYKTKNIWDCVAAHAVTNGLLAVYILAAHKWEFLNPLGYASAWELW